VGDSAVSLDAVLEAVLNARVPPAATGLAVALSGGADSACLLTALAQRPIRSLRVRALHIDHGLQPAAADFRRACEALCARLCVPLDIITVTVDGAEHAREPAVEHAREPGVRRARGSGVSIEAAARDARYRAFAEALAGGECLLTAHHELDQAETVLLQLLRGAGLKGLSAMPLCRPFGRGWHVRPLLDVSHGDLLAYAEQQGVPAVADPMNHDMRFDRAYLRERVWPLLEARWPGAETALARTARHVADAQVLLDEAAAGLVQRLRDGNALSVAGLRSLAPPAQRNALRYWIAAGGLEPPPAARLAEALRQVEEADGAKLPAVVWGEHALRRYRNRLFLAPATPPRISDCEWPLGLPEPLRLGARLGTLSQAAQRGGLDAARLPPALHVRRRAGGETLKPHRRARTQSVQHLCQSRGVLPWMRDALPMLYAGDALIAIGDLWLDARWCVAPQAPGVRVVWQQAPLLV
jgi:tRNA(Ile)-lysidine synthase